MSDVGGEETTSRLRGAGVEVDRRKAGIAVWVLLVGTVLVVAVLLAVGGAQKNSQISTLQREGVPVQVTVVTCVGQLGGSGSNAAGYNCTGRYTVNGVHYQQTIPGSQQRALASHFAGVVARHDPLLLTTPQILASEQVTWHVYVLPAILLLVAAGLLVGGLLLLRRGSGS